MTPSPAGPLEVRGALFYPQRESSTVAKVSPGQFVRQVRLEAIERVHWPTRKETIGTAIMVVIMTGLLATFFFGTDSAFHAIVKALLGLLS